MPREKKLKNEGQGVPQISDILQAARVEPLNSPVTVKLWPSVVKFIDEGPGSTFIREAILEKLEKIADRHNPGRCNQCVNLTTRDKEPFCLWMAASFLDYDKKHLSELFHCDGFFPKKEAKK